MLKIPQCLNAATASVDDTGVQFLFLYYPMRTDISPALPFVELNIMLIARLFSLITNKLGYCP